MLRVLGRPHQFCDGVTRRDLLHAGGTGLVGSLFGMPPLASAAERSTSPRRGSAKSVIFLFLHGGAATQDMWDLKPNAPEDVRGEFRPVSTSAPGVRVCEHLPLTAKWMHRSALIRSMSHRAGCHNPLATFTGYPDVEPVQNVANPNHPPSMGSVCEYLKDPADDLPAYACVPNHLGWGEAGRRPGIYAGYLGQRYDPLCADCNPSYDPGADTQDRGRPAPLRGRPTLPHTVLTEGVTLDRLDRRQSLLGQLDGAARRLDAQPATRQFGQAQQRAFSLFTAKRLKEAFDLDRESPRLRDRYGRTLFGESVLTARRLVEAGVRFVNVFWDNYAPRFQSKDFGWDTHELNFRTLKESYLPWLDRTYSALLEDLDVRGLLDETLVVTVSDMGRTPRVNATAGRDHWSYCYSAMLAGGGVRGGTVYGASDAHAAGVKDDPVSPADLCATVYAALGIDPEMTLYDRGNRPVPAALGGRAVREVLA